MNLDDPNLPPDVRNVLERALRCQGNTFASVIHMTEGDLTDWVEALEGGIFRQTKGLLLRSNNPEPLRGDETTPVDPSYCCLGVLCHLEKQRGLLNLLAYAKGGSWAYAGLQDTSRIYSTYLPVSTAQRYRCSQEGMAFNKVQLEGMTLPEEIQRRVLTPTDTGFVAGWATLSVLNDAGVPFPDIAKLLRKYVVVVKDYESYEILRVGL